MESVAIDETLTVDGKVYGAAQIRALEKRCISLKERKRYLEDVHEKEKKKKPKTCICSKRSGNASTTCYDDLKKYQKDEVYRHVKAYVTAGSQNAAATMANFIADTSAKGRGHEIDQKITEVLSRARVGKVFQKRLRNMKKKRVKEHEYAAIRFCDRKRDGLGRPAENKMASSRQESNRLQVTAEVTSSPLQKKLSSYDDKTAHKFFQTHLPDLPKVRKCEENAPMSQLNSIPKVHYCPAKIECEHASVNPLELLSAIVTMAYLQQELHKFFVWFLDKDLQPKYEHMEWGVCVDGFPVKNFSDGASMQSIQLYNMPGLVHKPDYNFPQALYMDSESSQAAWVFLRELDEVITSVEEHGFDLVLEGFEQNLTLPHCDIPVNGSHRITNGFAWKHDLKMRLLLFGSVSAV